VITHSEAEQENFETASAAEGLNDCRLRLLQFPGKIPSPSPFTKLKRPEGTETSTLSYEENSHAIELA
jgi:hypothetical protein